MAALLASAIDSACFAVLDAAAALALLAAVV